MAEGGVSVQRIQGRTPGESGVGMGATCDGEAKAAPGEAQELLPRGTTSQFQARCTLCVRRSLVFSWDLNPLVPQVRPRSSMSAGLTLSSHGLCWPPTAQQGRDRSWGSDGSPCSVRSKRLPRALCQTGARPRNLAAYTSPLTFRKDLGMATPCALGKAQLTPESF